MKTKKSLKRITAVVLCVIMLATSFPIAFAANGAYNPAPYFTDYAQSKGAAAWVDEEDNLQIRFPAATGRPTHAVWSVNHDETENVKAITKYIIELSDVGGKLEAHTANPPVLLRKEVPAYAATGKLSAVFTAEELGDLLDLENRRYNVAITAVDEAGWYSLQLHALIFDVPEFSFDESKFQTFTEDAYAMRELMRFEKTGSYSGHEESGGSIDKIAVAIHDGAEDPTSGINSKAYRMRIIKEPENGQSIDICESRQTWDFAGADEVWYWMDLSNVELKGLSFRLRSNYKRIDYNLSNKDVSTSQHYGSIVYSTLGTKNNTYAAGEEPYIWVQDETGNWDKVMMTNGTVNLGHFKGYVRIPVQFFCSEQASTVVSDSGAVFGNTKSYNQGNLNTFYDNEVCLSKPVNGAFTQYLEIDPAGTPIADALLIQNGKMFHSGNVFQSKLEYELGSFLAPGLGDDEMKLTSANNPRRATLSKDASGNWTVQNRENGYKALEDIYSAGIAYQGVSEDSLEESFFLDNIMFYRTDGERWAEASFSGDDAALSQGTAVKTYFDQGADAQDRILDAIDEYIGTPSWTDYRGVKYVQDMIATFKEVYGKAKGQDYINRYFTDEKLAERAADTGRTATWNEYQTAVTLCSNEGLLDGNNARPNDLVPLMVQSLEQLPDPSTVTTISDTLYNEIVKLYKAYVRLNYGQLKMLGNNVGTDADGNAISYYEEEKILKYAALLENRLEEDTVTGYKLAKNPFIPFNDFEQNTKVGDRAWRLEDDPTFASTSDYRHYKNFSTLTTNDKKVVDGNGQTISQSYTDKYDIHNYPHSADTRITNDGYSGTKGLTTTFESAALQGNDDDGVFYAIYFNKDSVNNITNFDDFKQNNMASVNLGQLAKDNDPNEKSALKDQVQNTDGSSYLPFSLVMYVDFSELTDEAGAGDFTFGVKLHTVNEKGEEICYRPAMGTSSQSIYWRSFYVMDQDPNSDSFGEWQRVFMKAHSGVQTYLFTSKTTQDDVGDDNTPANLAGYKGYIAIPINHFKRATFDTEKLYDKPYEMNHIYSITFGITNANGEAMNGKTITIDNVGFTYDPDYYKDQLGVDLSDRNDQSYAQIFEAKSTKATEFETAVANIDPYDTPENLAKQIEAAQKIYGYPYLGIADNTLGTLPQWQKDNIQTVKQAKALLDKYIAGDIPQAAMTVDELRAKIAALPNVPDNAVAENPLPSPGFVSNASDPRVAGTVNYTAFGFESKAQAEEIITYYTNTYKRLSAADKASLTDEERNTFLNAYYAAMRCADTLEMIKTDAEAFSEELKTVYTRYPEGSEYRNLVKATDRDRIATLSTDKYDPLVYYAKVGLSDGSIIPAYANMTDGISRYLANVQTDDTGKVDGGGVYELMKQYTQLYKDVKTYLDNKEVIPDALAAKLNEAIAEYNDLIPAYKNVFELYYGSEKDDASGEYQGIKDILDLFPRYSGSFENPVEGTDGKIANLDLNRDNEATESATLNIDYVEELPLPDAENGTGVNSVSYFKIKYNGTLTGGVDSRNYQLKLNGHNVPAVDLAADPVLVTDEMLGGSLKNNTADPFEMKFTATLTDTRTFAQQLTDTVTIYHYRPAKENTDEVGEQLIDTYTLNVTYTPSEAYTVTIPAEFPIDWGNTDEVDVSYTVTCVLGTGKKLAVYVDGKDGFLTAENDTAYTMNYTATGFGVGAKSTFQGVHIDAKPTTMPTVQISDTTWQESPVGKYKDTLTYTVEYTTS